MRLLVLVILVVVVVLLACYYGCFLSFYLLSGVFDELFADNQS